MTTNFRQYTGSDVATTGPDRHVEVTHPHTGRTCWARARRREGIEAELIGPVAVTVLGWGAAALDLEDFGGADRAALLGTIDPKA